MHAIYSVGIFDLKVCSAKYDQTFTCIDVVLIIIIFSHKTKSLVFLLYIFANARKPNIQDRHLCSTKVQRVTHIVKAVLFELIN